MTGTPPGTRFRSGFSLVEMMVVLLIMAGLVTATSVSLDTTRDKVRADKTAAIGREVAEALERNEGLSFVSDFGRLPRHADEVQFLFFRTFVDSAGTTREAAPYRHETLTLDALPDVPQEVVSAFGSPTLPVGWRGPYCHRVEFLDGWKNPWHVLDASGAPLSGGEISMLESWGRDHARDPDPLPHGQAWQDTDLQVSVERNLVTENIDLGIDVTIRDANGNNLTRESDFKEFHVFFFTPSFDGSGFLADSGANVERLHFERQTPASWSSPPAGRGESIQGTPFSLTLSGLTVGERLVFLYALGSGSETFAGAPKLVRLRPGGNHIDYTLNEQSIPNEQP